MPKVKRLEPLIGSMPMHPIKRPIPAAMMPLKIFPLDREATRVMAQKQREKYSHGPRWRANSAMTGESTVARATEPTVPIKEAVMPIPRALPACPFLVMGKPSKQVAIADDDPGIPISTAEMNVPETPPIQMASSRTKDVSVERPKVTGSKRAMPRVAESPGMAPNTMPRETMAIISSRLIGCRQTINALKYSVIYPVPPYPYSNSRPAGSFTWKPNTNMA